MPLVLPQIGTENALFDWLERTTRRVFGLRPQLTPELAARTTSMTRTYPWMAPGVVSSLAAANLMPDHPAVRRAATLSATQALDSGNFTQQGQPVRTERPSRYQDTLVGSPRNFLNLLVALAATGQEASRLVTGGAPSELRLSVRRELRGESTSPEEVRAEYEELRQTAPLPGLTPDQVKALGPGGNWASPGRLFAQHVTEPGRLPFKLVSGLVDGAFTMLTDPTTFVTPGAGTAYRAGRGVIGEAARGSARNPSAVRKLAGLVDTPRPQAITDQVTSWLDSGVGRDVTEWMARTSSFTDIWETTKGQLGAQTTEALRAAPDTLSVRGVLDRALTSGGVREYPASTPTALGLSVRHRTDRIRFLQMVPGRAIDAEHLDDAAEQLLRSARNAKLDTSTIDGMLQRVGSLQEGDRVGLFDVVKGHYADVNRKLAGSGLTKAEADKLAGKVFEGAGDDARAYWVNTLGENGDFPGARTAILQGREVVQPTAHIPSEMLNRAIPLPDAREVRRATSWLSPILTERDRLPNQIVRGAIDAAASAQSDILKPLWLLRAKWLTRVTIDEQARMAFAGLDSVYNHPFAWMSAALAAPQGRLSRLAARLVPGEGRLTTGLEDEALELLAEHADAVGNQQNYLLGRGKVGQGLRGMLRVMHPSADPTTLPKYTKAWATELSSYASDPAMRAAATLAEPDYLDWFATGAGRDWRDQLALASRARDLTAQEQAVYGVRTVEEAFNGSRRFVDDYARSMRQRLMERTNGDAEILDAIAAGTADGVDLVKLRDLSSPDGRRFVSWIGDRVDRGPSWSKHSQLDDDFGGSRGQWDRAVTWMFDSMFGKPDAFLSRSPTFRQYYWQRATELIPHMDAPTRTAFFERAADTNLGKRELAHARELAARFTPGTAITDVEGAAAISRRFALDATQRLLYDTSAKHQFADVLRITNPFVEPIVEALTIWPKLAASNPRYTLRAAHAVAGAKGAGFFYPDPVTDEETFAYPSPGLAAALGLPDEVGANITGKLSGLDMVTSSLLPSFGPVVQIPAAALLPDKPEWDSVREALFPFGEPTRDAPLSTQLAEEALPTWAKRLQTFFTDDPSGERTWDNSVLEMMQALAATGEYSNASGGLDVERLQSDSKASAKRLMLVKAFAQFTLPTGEKVEYTVEGHEIRALSVELRKRQQSMGFSEGTEAFIDEFGTDLGAAVQGKSRALEERSLTKQGLDFERDHPDLVNAYGPVIGFFNPIGPDQPFDVKAWSHQLEDTRTPKTPVEYAQLYNAYLGNVLWDRAKARLIDAEGGMRSDAGAVEWLSAVREAIGQEYPGFQATIVGSGQTLDTEEKIALLERAVKDDRLLRTDAGQGLDLYLLARAKVNRVVADNPTSYNGAKSAMQAKSAKHLRDWLRNVAGAISREHPEFAPMWERVLSREMTERDELIPEAA